MKALIVGAGVCGPVTAMALQQAGIAAEVFEARRPAAEAGSYLTVATNGLDALRAIDAHGPVLAAGFPDAMDHHGERHRQAARPRRDWFEPPWA